MRVAAHRVAAPARDWWGPVPEVAAAVAAAVVAAVAAAAAGSGAGSDRGHRPLK